MENKVIAKEYVEANFLHKDLIRLAIKEGMSDAKGIGQEGGAQCIANILLVMIGDKDARTLDSFTI